MNYHKAHKRIQKKISRALPCPFCGKTPEFTFRVDKEYSKHGSFGHYVSREGCCPPTRAGQTELFFCNNWKKPDYQLWKGLADRVIDQWNKRVQ